MNASGNRVLLVTLDTNVVRDVVEQHRLGHEEALAILGHSCAGRLRSQVTNRIDKDVPDGELRRKLEGLGELEPSRPGAPFRIGVSRIGSPDYLVSEKECAEEVALLQLLFPGASPKGKHHSNRQADIDHLLAHRRSGARYYVTREKAILNNAKVLAERFGIDVLSPSELLERVVA